MPQATQAAFDARSGIDDGSVAGAKQASATAPVEVHIAIHGDLASIESEWRAFERVADCTPFQTFDWVSTWQRHIGERNGVVPAIVAGRDGQGRLLCLLPFGIEPGVLGRCLTWLGTTLCDYNGPLLARDFGQRVDTARFKDMWGEVCRTLQGDQRFRFDAVYFDKMQNVVGVQANPFVTLGVVPHADGAYLTELGTDWEKFYAEKRSAATRRTDRSKRKKLAELGELRFITAVGDELPTTLDLLLELKAKSLIGMGATNIFALPGYRDFYHALSQLGGFVHISRYEVGSRAAAANLGLIFNGAYYHLVASYDEELSRYSPGAAHIQHLLQFAIEQGHKIYDFTLGDERYKQEWCEDRIVLYDHIATATLRGSMLAAKLYAVGRIKHFIKQNPVLWDKAFKLRIKLGALKHRLRG